jgi:hypothetical protein
MAQRGRWLGCLRLLTPIAMVRSRLKRDGEQMPAPHRVILLREPVRFQPASPWGRASRRS